MRGVTILHYESAMYKQMLLEYKSVMLSRTEDNIANYLMNTENTWLQLQERLCSCQGKERYHTQFKCPDAEPPSTHMVLQSSSRGGESKYLSQ
jgi:hypothetical protein